MLTVLADTLMIATRQELPSPPPAGDGLRWRKGVAERVRRWIRAR
jgi:hypothetical protein